MRFSTLGYYWREAMVSMLRNSWLSIASVGTVTISLLILGFSLFLVLNTHSLTQKMESTVEISAFLADNVKDEEVSEIQNKIKFLPGVEKVDFISKDQTLKSMKDDFGDRSDILEGLEKDNPFPHTLMVKTREAGDVATIAAQIETLSGIEEVRYGQNVVEKLLSITHFVRISGLVAVGILGMAAIFLISTTIRMSVFSRRREIGIMKMLGATNWFVRLPFLLEGMLLGLLGALLAVAMLQVAYVTLVERLNYSLPFISLVTDQYTISLMFGGLAALGLLIGTAGSVISLHKFLKV